MPRKISDEIPFLVKLARSDKRILSNYASKGIFLILNADTEFTIDTPHIYAGIILFPNSKLTINNTLGTEEFPVLYCQISKGAKIIVKGNFYCVNSEIEHLGESITDSDRVISCEVPAEIRECSYKPESAILPVALLYIAGITDPEIGVIHDTPWDRFWRQSFYVSDESGDERDFESVGDEKILAGESFGD